MILNMLYGMGDNDQSTNRLIETMLITDTCGEIYEKTAKSLSVLVSQ